MRHWSRHEKRTVKKFLFQWSSSRIFSFWNRVVQIEWTSVTLRARFLHMPKCPFPQDASRSTRRVPKHKTRPEVCCHLQHFLSLNRPHLFPFCQFGRFTTKNHKTIRPTSDFASSKLPASPFGTTHSGHKRVFYPRLFLRGKILLVKSVDR